MAQYSLRMKRFRPKALWVLHGEATISRETNNSGRPSCEGAEEGFLSVSHSKALAASPRNAESALGQNRPAMHTMVVIHEL